MKNPRYISIDSEMSALIKEIYNYNFSLTKWCEICSDDMFQSTNYCGGFEDDGMGSGEFTFSKYFNKKEISRLSIPFENIEKIIKGEIINILEYDPE